MRLLHLGLAAALPVAIFLAQNRAGAQPAEPIPAAPQEAIEPATGVVIDWEVVNRFRLFRDQRDFRRHVEAQRGRSVLDAERALAEETDGHGWTRDMVARLCLGGLGLVAEECVRDGVRESYLNPADHPVEVRLAGLVPAGAACTWRFSAAGDPAPLTASADCGEPVTFRARYGTPTTVSVDVAEPGAAVRRATAEIAVRDLLIAGLGDSVASGDGNPDRPVALADQGFCFRRFLAGGVEYFRPGRVGFSGDRACDGDLTHAAADRAEWAKLSAWWMNAACHRSLYGYQLRTALALAIETVHAAVTFLPLACTGATIDVGLFNGQRSRELLCGAGGAACPATTPGQIGELRDLLARARRTQSGRALDLVFLTIGANDIGFSSLIADALIEGRGERALLSRAGILSTAEASQAILDRKLPQDFSRLRNALKPLVGDDLERVVFVSYGHPALSQDGGPCPGGRSGFDVHPAFGLDAERLRRAAKFVSDSFLPALKNIATCTAKGACADASDAMTFVDRHQAAFAEHGFCAQAEADPPFDRDCFSPDGTSFEQSLVRGANEPLACGLPVADFRAYARRARWIRTANDSYFAAMTFPQGVAAGLAPGDLHDATWGVLAAVYGGAIHPTAEGHAAMADAALAGAKVALHLSVAPAPVLAAPLPPLPAGPR